MADITMCDDKECPRAHTCYRFTANANPYRQSYFMQSPRHGDGCPQFVTTAGRSTSPPMTDQKMRDKQEGAT